MSEKVRLIYRAEHSKENPYFQMLRATAQNRELTFEARGVLAYVLSKPDDWRVQPSDLEQQCKKSVVYRVLGELIKHGYIERKQERNEKKQIIAWHYLVHENPLPKKQEVALPEVGKLEVEKTDTTEYREEQKKEKKRKKDNTPRKRDIVFEAIGYKVFELSSLDGISGSRLGKLASIARKVMLARIANAADEQIADFVTRFAATQPKKQFIQGNDTFELNFARFVELQPAEPSPSSAPPPPTEPAPVLTPEQVEQRIMEYNRIMAELNDAIVEKVVA